MYKVSNPGSIAEHDVGIRLSFLTLASAVAGGLQYLTIGTWATVRRLREVLVSPHITAGLRLLSELALNLVSLLWSGTMGRTPTMVKTATRISILIIFMMTVGIK